MRTLWLIINFPRSIPALLMYHHLPCRNQIRADLQRWCYNTDWWNLHTALLDSSLFRKLFYYRTNQHSPLLTKVSKILYCPFETMELHADAIGGGMKIFHGYSTIVFARSVGRNFTVYQQVTIGRGTSVNGNDIPIIGDNVTVYAGAIIVGGVRIGNNVTIGAGAVVVKDVPDNTTVVGAPVRVIQKYKVKKDDLQQV